MRLDGRRAWLTADLRIALIVKPIVRKLLLHDVIPHVLGGPLDDRVDLLDTALRGVDLPSCYAAVWDRVCGLEAGDFNHEGLCMLFHVYLMHTSSDTTRSVKVAYPAWVMVDAREAWIRNVRDDNTVSDAQRDLAGVFGELADLQKLHEDVQERYDYEVGKRTGAVLDLEDENEQEAPPPEIDADNIQKRFGLAEADADAMVVVSASGGAPIGPAGSETVSIDLLNNDRIGLQISFASMLVNTNDAFTSLNTSAETMAIGDILTFDSVAYDAGTEADTESATDIPGPAGGGTGFDAARDDQADRVSMHNGIVSQNDGLATSDLTEQHRFDNPVARISIERIN